MTQLHYFQRYSQRENVDTNNTLLLLARIQAHDPRLLRTVLLELFRDSNLDGSEFEIGAKFSQQTHASASVPDGMLYQSSFRIVIETKRHGNFSSGQLNDHLSAFHDETVKVLLLLAPVRVDCTAKDAPKRNVYVISRTFADIIAACAEGGLREHIELREMIDDYESFCHESGLISDEADRMMVVTAGATLAENRAMRVYYAPADRGFQKHRLLGLYSDKAVRVIGEIENIITADLIEHQFVVHHSTSMPTDDQKERIKKAIDSAPGHGWNISRGCMFFLVHRFADTTFRKTSRGGLRGKRYFSIQDEIGLRRGEGLPDVDTLARKLSERTWE